ncbi:MAG: putative toxin-antitoxin system toxin component, PIN family [Actinomycetaceae bacterium]|nr:putative toxin-antitoxin system toxin component, PIN family [Actinomycetaceae bacterium]
MAMKYYAVIDTNVLVSAMIKWQSVPGSVLEFALSGMIVPLLNTAIVDEYREVLARPKFGLTEDIIADIIASLEKSGFYVDAEETEIDLPDPKDRIFYEVVMEERKEENAYLVTGNIKHFPNEPFIVTPRQMLDIILEDTNF